jgi:predicted ester cyclase
MSLQANKALVRRYYEDAPYHPEACDEIFAPRFLFHTIQRVNQPAQEESSPERERAAYEWFQATWGGWDMTIEEMIAEGDRVMVRWTHRGTQLGEIRGLPPTHKQVIVAGINIFRVAGGKIVEVWDISDRLGMWQQLGVLPELQDAIAEAEEAMRSKPRSPPR